MKTSADLCANQLKETLNNSVSKAASTASQESDYQIMEDHTESLRDVSHIEEYYEGEPMVSPVLGIVQPNVNPSAQRPRRHTNCLNFLKKNVITALMNHQNGWPFLEPVDAILYQTTDYHNIISHPMDLGTISQRLTNNWYYSADQCIQDIRLVFNNCYTYNNENIEVFKLAKVLENFFQVKLKGMPKIEQNMGIDNIKRRRKKCGTRSRRAYSSSKSRARKNVATTNYSAAIVKENKLSHADAKAGFSGQSSSANAVEHYQTGPIGSKLAMKRKADTTSQPSTLGAIMGYPRPMKISKPAIKNNLDRPSLKKTSMGIQDELRNDQMKFCLTLSDELFTKKHFSYASPFYKPFDAQYFGWTNYYKKIKTPMDLTTVRNKLNNKKYRDPQAYADDMRLIFTNCYKYNPSDTKVYLLTLKLHDIFEKLFSKIPDGRIESIDVTAHFTKQEFSRYFLKLGESDGAPSSTMITSTMASGCDANNKRNIKLQKLEGDLKLISENLNYLYSRARKKKNKRKYNKMRDISSNPPNNIKGDLDDNLSKNGFQSKQELNIKSEKNRKLQAVNKNVDDYAGILENSEREQLCEAANKLPLKKMSQLFNIIKQLEPLNVEETSQDGVRIYFENLKPSSIKEIQEYIAKVTSRKNKPRKSYSTIKSSEKTSEKQLKTKDLKMQLLDVYNEHSIKKDSEDACDNASNRLSATSSSSDDSDSGSNSSNGSSSDSESSDSNSSYPNSSDPNSSDPNSSDTNSSDPNSSDSNSSDSSSSETDKSP